MEIYGDSTVQTTEIKTRWNHKTGYVTNVVYKGTPTAVTTFAENLVGAAYVTDIDLTTKGLGQVTVTYQGDNDLGGNDIAQDETTQWTLQGVDLLLPLNARRYWDDDLSTVDDADVREAIQKWYSRVVHAAQPDVQKIVDLLDKGTTEYYVNQLLVSKTEVATGDGVDIDFEKVNRACSIGDIEGLPATIKTAMETMPEYTGDKQFLKRQPSLETLENGKYRVTHSWLWDVEWSNVIYDGNGVP